MEADETVDTNKPAKKRFFSLKNPKRFIRLLFGGFFLWLFIRSFFFQVMYIPSSSMRGTLQEGDYILVNKFAYGPRMPITLFSLPFAGSTTHLDWVEFNYHRAPGYSEIKRNDVVVFNFPDEKNLPIDLRHPFIKRCIGIPGDSVAIVNGEVFVNGQRTDDPYWEQRRYFIVMKNSSGAEEFFRKLNITEPYITQDHLHYMLLVNNYQLNLLRASGKISAFSLNRIEKKIFNVQLFPHDPHYKWNSDFYGALFIPGKGKTVMLDTKNICLYRDIISAEEKNKVEIKSNKVFINDQPAASYTFKENYFFMLGDNRYDSEDSRYWGFVPESHVIGKASVAIKTSGPLGNLSLIR
jgi:signal peptidase I